MITSEIIYHARLLELQARKKADHLFGGSFLSAFKGEGLDLKDVREYVTGDDVRRIDWNVSARTGRPHVKTFYEDRNINLVVAADLSASMNFGSGDRTKREVMMEIISLLLLAGSLYRHKTSFVGFSQEVDLFLKLRSGEAEVMKALTRIIQTEEQEPHRNSRTDFEKLVHFLESVTRKRGILFVLSDFLGLKDPQLLNRLRQRFQLNLFHITDPLELKAFSAYLPLLLRDMETGGQLNIKPGESPMGFSQFKEFYKREILDVDAASFRLPDLLQHFNRRQRRII